MGTLIVCNLLNINRFRYFTLFFSFVFSMPPKKQVESRKARQNRARRAKQQALAKLAKELAGVSIVSRGSPSTSWADQVDSEHRLKLLPGFTCTECGIDPILPFHNSKGFSQTDRKLTIPAALSQEPNLRINRVVLVVTLNPAVPDTDKFWAGIINKAWSTPSVSNFPSGAVRITGKENLGHYVYHFPGKTVELLSNLHVMYFSSNYAGGGDDASPVALTKVFVEHEKIGQAEYIEF